MDAARDDESITGVLVEELVGLHVQRVGQSVPHDLVDADFLWCGTFVAGTAVMRTRQFQQEHGVAADRAHVNRSIEWNRQSWLEVEAIERVEDADVLAIRAALLTVGERQIDSYSRGVGGRRRRELIAGKRGRLDPAEIEQRMNGRRLAHAEYEGKNRENNCHWSNVRVHGLSLRVGGQPEWPGLSTHVRRVVSY